MWKLFNEVFDCLPFSAIVEEKILCVHAGLSPELQSLEQLRRIPRPTEIPDAGLLCDLLWSDPEITGIRGWGESDRGVSFTFGEDVVTKFLARTDLDLICRAHQASRLEPVPFLACYPTLVCGYTTALRAPHCILSPGKRSGAIARHCPRLKGCCTLSYRTAVPWQSRPRLVPAGWGAAS